MCLLNVIFTALRPLGSAILFVGRVKHGLARIVQKHQVADDVLQKCH
jgi:hypothetical protein